VTIVQTVCVTRDGTASLEVRVHHARRVNGAMEAQTTRAIMHPRLWKGVMIFRTAYATRDGTASLEVFVHYAMRANGAIEAQTTCAIIHLRQW
jgi:hypothetical protein